MRWPVSTLGDASAIALLSALTVGVVFAVGALLNFLLWCT